MKLLHLPILAVIALPTAVEANPTSGDIVFKTLLGEKYYVKEKSVTFDSNDIRGIKYSLSGKVYRSLAESYQNGFFGKVDNSKASIFTRKAERAEAKYPKFKAELDKYNNQEITSYTIYYQPIFQNLNTFKILMEERKITCINPKFKNKYFVKAYHKSLPNPSLKLNFLDKKVCEKYAKF